MSGSRRACCKCGSGTGEPIDSCCVRFYPATTQANWRAIHRLPLAEGGKGPIAGQGISISATISITRTSTKSTGQVTTQVHSGTLSFGGGGANLRGVVSAQGIAAGCEAISDDFRDADSPSYSYTRTDTYERPSEPDEVYNWSESDVVGETFFQCYPAQFYYSNGVEVPDPPSWLHFRAYLGWQIEAAESTPSFPIPFQSEACALAILSDPSSGEFFARVTGPGVSGRGFSQVGKCVAYSGAPDFSSGSVTADMSDTFVEDTGGGNTITHECTGTITITWEVLEPPFLCPEQTLPTYTESEGDCDQSPTPPGDPPTGPPPGGCCPNDTGLYWPDASDAATLRAGTRITIRRYNATTGALQREWIVRIPPTSLVRQDAACAQYRTTIQGQRNAAGGSQPGTIPGTEAYAFDPNGFSGTDWFIGGGSTTNTIRNLYFAAQLDFGDDDALPSGARIILDVHDGIRSSASKVFSATITPGALPGTVANITLSSGRIGGAVMADLRTSGQDFYHTGADDKFYYAAVLGWRQGDVDTQSGVRWEIEVEFEPECGGFGPCPPPEEDPDALLALTALANPESAAAIERHMEPATKCRGCEKG